MAAQNDDFNASAEKNADDIIPYAEAGPTLRARMDHLLETIDRNPDSYEAVLSFGSAAFDNGLSRPALRLALGASGEALRRYDEEYIPAAEKAYENSDAPGDLEYLDDVRNCAKDLKARIGILESAWETRDTAPAKQPPKPPSL